MAVWDLLDLGLSYPGYGWDRVRIWPRAARERLRILALRRQRRAGAGRENPAFHGAGDGSQRHPDTARSRAPSGGNQPMANRLAAVRDNAVAGGASRGQLDLRVRVEDGGLRLLVMLPGKTEFEEMKIRQFEALLRDYHEGLLTLTEEADVIFPSFRVSDYATPVVTLSYDSSSGGPAAQPGVPGRPPCQPPRGRRRRAATAGGAALEVVRDSRADGGRGLYISMVQEDGTPAPPILVSLPGSPVLHMTGKCGVCRAADPGGAGSEK